MSSVREGLDGPEKQESLDSVNVYLKTHAESTLCTEALHRYLERNFVIFDSFFFGINLATSSDEKALIVAKALASGGTEKDKNRLAEMLKNKDRTIKKLQSFGAFQSENMCIRSVDNFLNYISDTIQSCMRSRPELLRSSESVKLEDVLRFDNYESLIEFLVERKINKLSYGRINGINEFLVKRTGI